MFVSPKVFKLIGPSNDGRRHGRGTYLFSYEGKNKKITSYYFIYIDIRDHMHILVITSRVCSTLPRLKN
jgi:hypothetical protein